MGKTEILMMLSLKAMNTAYLSIYWNCLLFHSAMLCSFQCTHFSCLLSDVSPKFFLLWMAWQIVFYYFNFQLFFSKFPFFKKTFFLLDCSWFTVLCWFPRYSRVIQLYMYMCLFFFRFFPYRSSQNIKQNFLCYTVGPCWLSILYIVVCICQFHTSNLSFLPIFPLW